MPDQDGAGLSVLAGLAVSLDAHTAGLNSLSASLAAGRPSWTDVHPVQLAPQALPAAGVVDDPDRMGPRAGWAWHIAFINATAAVTVFRDSTRNPPLFAFPGPGMWEPRQLILLPGQRLVYQAAAAVTILAEASEISLDWLPSYLL